MLRKEDWLFGFISELQELTQGCLDREQQVIQTVSLQQWERLPDEDPALVARRWAHRAGLRSGPQTPPTVRIWLSECAEEFQRQQPSLGRHVANALALLQWDLHGDLTPTEAALHWVATHPPLSLERATERWLPAPPRPHDPRRTPALGRSA